jgi:hypothetical protein
MLVGMFITFTASHSICLSAMVHALPPEKKNYFQLFARFVFLVFHKKWSSWKELVTPDRSLENYKVNKFHLSGLERPAQNRNRH